MAMATSKPARRWLVHSVDLDTPIEPVDMAGSTALYLTVFSGPDPLGTVLVPCQADICSATLIREVIKPYRAEAFKKALRRGFDGPDHGQLPSASIVVCTRNRAESLRRCLGSLTRLEGLSAEIIVVDNGSGDDGTAEVAAGFDVRYVFESVPGLDRARNRGAAEATGEIVLYTDDDVEVDRCWASRLLEGFDDPLTVAVTGAVLAAAMDNEGRIEFEKYAGFIRTLEPLVLDGTYTDPTSAGRAGAGASMAFRRNYLLSIAGFPEELDAGQATSTGGDTYALYQALKDGLRVRFEPRALAFHHHRQTRELARSAVEGYGTGTISYFVHGVQTNRDPAAAAAAVKWLGTRTARLVKSLALTGPGVQSGYLAAECRGMVKAPTAYARARRDVDSRPLILQDTVAWDPVAPSGLPESQDQIGDSELPTISVVIPTMGRDRSLAGTLRALSHQDYEAGKLEVVVADDSPDGSAVRLLDELDLPLAVTAVRTGGSGAGVARNIGAANSDGELLVFLDDDIRPRLDTHLRSIAEAHRQGSDAVLGPILPAPVNDPDLLTMAVRNWWIDQSRALLGKNRAAFTDICTGNLAVARSTFDRIGGFNPLPRREDWEFGLRLLDSGASVGVVAAAAVDHLDRPTVAGSIRRRHLEGGGDIALARLHPDRLNLTALGSWLEFSPREIRAVRAMIANPDRALRSAFVLAKGLPALEAAGSRRRFAKLLSRVNQSAYWAGVGQAAGGLEGWFELLSAHTDALSGHTPAVLELTDARSWDLPAIPVSEVVVHHRGEFVGIAPVRWGGTPWSRSRFADTVVHRFADNAIRIEAIGASPT